MFYVLSLLKWCKPLILIMYCWGRNGKEGKWIERMYFTLVLISDSHIENYSYRNLQHDFYHLKAIFIFFLTHIVSTLLSQSLHISSGCGLELITCALIKRRKNVLWPMVQGFNNAVSVSQLCQKLEQ